MSEWTNPEDEFFESESESLAEVEALLRMAADDMPTVRSGLRSEIVTHAQKAQREIRFQHMLWGGLASLLLFFGGLVWWPMSPDSAVASNAEPPPKAEKPSGNSAPDSVDWELVESQNQLRRRNLESLRNAF